MQGKLCKMTKEKLIKKEMLWFLATSAIYKGLLALFSSSYLRLRWHHLTPSKVSRQILPKWRWIEKPSERFSSCCHHQRQRGAEVESSLDW